MKIAIIISKTDPAALNINDKLLENYSFEEQEDKYNDNNTYKLKDKNIKHEVTLYQTNKESINCEHIDKEIDADFFIFATRHQAASGIPSFSVHAPGNWAKAEYGGENRKLNKTLANYQKEAYILLNKNAIEGFEVVNEVTHHGPYLETPCMFIEIGSTEKQWTIKEAAQVIAKTIIDLLKTKIKQYTIAFGIGGLHTCPNFNKVILNTDYAIGHICPKYMLEELDKELILQAMKTSGAKLIILDWKGLKDQKEQISNLIQELNIESKRTKELTK